MDLCSHSQHDAGCGTGVHRMCGLEELRGAKAELLKAKAQVQLALAEVEAANARYRDQETAWMKAKADYEAQVAREKELQNDLLEAKLNIEVLISNMRDRNEQIDAGIWSDLPYKVKFCFYPSPLHNTV